MSVYYIGCYDIVDGEAFSRYPAVGLYNDPAYREGKRLRQRTSNVSMVLVEEFKMPANKA